MKANAEKHNEPEPDLAVFQNKDKINTAPFECARVQGLQEVDQDYEQVAKLEENEEVPRRQDRDSEEE